MTTHLLSYITFLPFLGALFILMLPKERARLIEWSAFLASALVLLLSIFLFTAFKGDSGNFEFVEKISWIPALNISYHLGVDGLSLFLVLLTSLLTPIAIVFSWGKYRERTKEYFALLLLLQTGMSGTFLALDTFLFYIFWELMLIPMYLIIGVWGGPRRIYAAIKFVLFTMVGSLLMLFALIYLYHQHYLQFGVYSSNLLDLYRLSLTASEQLTLFIFFGLAFAIKVPIFPFHTWLPDAHVEAPAAGSVILAGVLLKMGGYGFLRFAFPLFPDAVNYLSPLLTMLAVISIIYGALLAMVQKDIKRLVAYSSVSHMGFVMLGMLSLTVLGVQGSIYQMLNHGLSTGALFLLIGIIYQKRHSRLIEDFGGIAASVPIFSLIFLIVTLSSIGLPGLNGFVGEFLILSGTFISSSISYAKLYTFFAASGIVLGAVYMLWMFQRVFFGKLDKEENRHLTDLNKKELAYLAPILILIFFMGIYPKPILEKMEKSTVVNIQRIEKKIVEVNIVGDKN